MIKSCQNTKFNRDLGSKTSTIESECREIGEGLSKPNFKINALKAGVLALYAVEFTGITSTKLKIQPNPICSKLNMVSASVIAADSATHQGMKHENNSGQQITEVCQPDSIKS